MVTIKEHGKVSVTAEGPSRTSVRVEGFHFKSSDEPADRSTRTTSALAAIDWAIEKLQEARVKEW